MIRLLLILLVFFQAQAVFATKPCPPPPCVVDNKFNEAKCVEVSDWVAVGKISDVVHDKKGEPLYRDFAKFKFTISKVKKGKVKVGESINFQVGWCVNMGVPPYDTTGEFIFYGRNSKPSIYIHFDRY